MSPLEFMFYIAAIPLGLVIGGLAVIALYVICTLVMALLSRIFD